MKKTVTQEVECCDWCGTQLPHHTTCLRCKKVACFNCQQEHFVTYLHGMHAGGSGDGHYCSDCELHYETDGRPDELWTAYNVLDGLREEQRQWTEKFRERVEQAEQAIDKLTAERGVR